MSTTKRQDFSLPFLFDLHKRKPPCRSRSPPARELYRHMSSSFILNLRYFSRRYHACSEEISRSTSATFISL